MKSKRFTDLKGCIYYKSNKLHGLWNNSNIFIGHHFQNKEKGFWLRIKKQH